MKNADRNAEIVALRSNGATLQWIGDKYGLSRERVRQIVNAASNPNRRKHMTGKTTERIIYPEIQRWMRDKKIKWSELSEMTGVSAGSLSKFLKGRGGARIDSVEKILAVTGLTFEEAFRTEE